MKTVKKAKKRLSKYPSGNDYVVQFIWDGGERTMLTYTNDRSSARFTAKSKGNADRVRVFRIKYVLVSDSKRKARK